VNFRHVRPSTGAAGGPAQQRRARPAAPYAVVFALQVRKDLLLTRRQVPSVILLLLMLEQSLLRRGRPSRA